MITLNDIWKIEDSNDFDKAFDLYLKLYESDKTNFEIWKHFYFFLWISIEEASEKFQNKIKLRDRLKELYEVGKTYFYTLTEYKFITGYTVSLFPYEFGDYEDLEKEGNDLLFQASQIEPENKIYRMVYLGSIVSEKEVYRKSEIEASPIVLEKYKGAGFLNRYFREVLNRIDNKA